MVKVVFREVCVRDGDIINVPECTALSIHVEPESKSYFFVTWLEEVKE